MNERVEQLPRHGTSGDSPESPAMLAASGVCKSYGGVHALRAAFLRVGAGEVHGLVGENGSGKSTFLRILSGQINPDQADISLGGEPLPLGNPIRSLAAGIATVTQETTLVPDLSVAENIVLGRRAVRRWWGIDGKASRRRAVELLERLKLDLDVRMPVSRLRPDEKQMVEIVRAISMNARVLILDEPTSSLTDEEVEALFGVVRDLKEHGVSTIFVSHRLKEVFAIADRVTVLRNGETVAERATVELDTSGLIALMVGEEVEDKQPAVRPVTGGEVKLRVSGLSVPGMIEDVAFEVAPGEIVGFSGLVGAGRSELLKALFGLHPRAEGSIEIDGADAWSRNPREAMRNGIAFVPADRKEQGLILQMSIRENLVMAGSATKPRLRGPSRRREMEALIKTVDDFQVSGARGQGGAPIGSLSGGNQQKIVLAKWLAISPQAILLDEPTRGVDVGAKGEIYSILDQLRNRGTAMLVSSSETPELLRLCDRIFVMFRGRIVVTMTNEDASESAIAHYSTGAH